MLPSPMKATVDGVFGLVGDVLMSSSVHVGGHHGNLAGEFHVLTRDTG